MARRSSSASRRSRSPRRRSGTNRTPRRSRSRSPRRSRSPLVRRSRSPLVRRSRSPAARRSLSPDVATQSSQYTPASQRSTQSSVSTKSGPYSLEIRGLSDEAAAEFPPTELPPASCRRCGRRQFVNTKGVWPVYTRRVYRMKGKAGRSYYVVRITYNLHLFIPY